MDAKQTDQLSEMLDSVEITGSSGIEDLSPFEKLPCGIVFTIFECVPEAICDLRLVSKLVEARVNEFVRQRAVIRLVHEIAVYDNYYLYDNVLSTVVTNPPGMMQIKLLVPVRTVVLFKLRLKFRTLAIQSNLTDRISKDIVQERGALGLMNIYLFNVDAPFTSDTVRNEWECLLDAMGSSVTRARVPHARGDRELATACKLLEDIHFTEMEYNFENPLSTFARNHVLDTVKLHKVEHLAIHASSAPETPQVDFLLELSSLLRSLHMSGQFVPYEPEFEWAPHIVKMLSRKLDKLQMNLFRYKETCSYDTEYLSREGADLLIEKLPFLGKKVWFKTNFSKHATGRSTKLKGHVIVETRFKQPNRDKELSIIHKSRINELSPRDC